MKVGDEEITSEKVQTSVKRAVHYFSALQASDGHWPAENSGCMFFMPPLESQKRFMIGSLPATESSSPIMKRPQFHHPHNSKLKTQGRPWCNHCHKLGHTKNVCKEIPGKSANWKPGQALDGCGFLTHSEENRHPRPFFSTKCNLNSFKEFLATIPAI
ncbi:hypothetical protein Nepgr_016903 [Nepenthes gracilis]|uniref:Uncharacterized protein n=1 Tax=Nepenthes gracilis TaxID=150966 RepID=A0AAD3SRE0_NEPGR|nr:hypothetical protein Nepgr_016903 [Nepenthes gracilis]